MRLLLCSVLALAAACEGPIEPVVFTLVNETGDLLDVATVDEAGREPGWLRLFDIDSVEIAVHPGRECLFCFCNGTCEEICEDFSPTTTTLGDGEEISFEFTGTGFSNGQNDCIQELRQRAASVEVCGGESLQDGGDRIISATTKLCSRVDVDPEVAERRVGLSR